MQNHIPCHDMTDPVRGQITGKKVVGIDRNVTIVVVRVSDLREIDMKTKIYTTTITLAGKTVAIAFMTALGVDILLSTALEIMSMIMI